jgi:hypothetical protein
MTTLIEYDVDRIGADVVKIGLVTERHFIILGIWFGVEVYG